MGHIVRRIHATITVGDSVQFSFFWKISNYLVPVQYKFVRHLPHTGYITILIPLTGIIVGTQLLRRSFLS